MAPCASWVTWTARNRLDEDPKSGWVASSDKISVSRGLTFDNGTLDIALEGDLVGGEEFDLFDAGVFNGAFYACNLPALPPGLNWCFNRLSTEGVLAINRRPVATTLSVQTAPGIPLNLSAATVAGACWDADGQTLGITAAGQAAHGVSYLNADGSMVIYNPAPGYTGVDQFSYAITDFHGGSNTAEVLVNVSCPTTNPTTGLPCPCAPMRKSATFTAGSPATNTSSSVPPTWSIGSTY